MKKFTIENKKFSFTINENAIAESLIHKASGEELLQQGADVPIFSVTQLRPFNNEVKLAYMNKRTTFAANKIELDGNKITVGFEIVPCQAVVSFEVNDDYVVFTLDELTYPENAYGLLCMDFPPVEEFRLLQLPVKNREYYGKWINAVWDEKASVAVVGTMPEAIIDSEKRDGFCILTAEAKKEVRLKGTAAALVVSGGREEFLDSVDALEHNCGLPLGVKSRRSDIINRSIYWTSRLDPTNVDEHIKYAKMAGFSCITLYFTSICPLPKTVSYGTCGDYSFGDKYPGGYEDLKAVIKKIKNAGIIPGIHFLHTHIGMYTKYVTPIADPRLNVVQYYTLSRPLKIDDDKIYVAENPKNALMHEKRRVLRFGGELMTYEGFSTVPPYHFYGVKRGYWETNVAEHAAGYIGGILDISEFVGTSVYINQNTDLQDEIAEEIAKLYDCGFEYVYFDGSEGTNVPYEYHVPNAQYRVLKKLGSAPLFCEGAAKAHFSWHHLSGANAFDAFTTAEFKEMLDKHPLAEASRMAQDFTRLNFGWWSFFDDTRRDVYEYGTSRAFGWDSPVTVMSSLEKFKKHPRIADILEVIRRWEYARENDIITDEEKELLKQPGLEHTLLINENGEYELAPYFAAVGTDGENPEWTAFVFERKGKSYAIIWHNTGSARLQIPIDDAIYERELGQKRLELEKLDGTVVIEISDAAYLSADIPMEELRSAIRAARIVK